MLRFVCFLWLFGKSKSCAFVITLFLFRSTFDAGEYAQNTYSNPGSSQKVNLDQTFHHPEKRRQQTQTTLQSIEIRQTFTKLTHVSRTQT